MVKQLGSPLNTNDSQKIIRETDELFRAIGCVVVSFQLLELWVAEALSGSLGMKAIDDRHLLSAAMSYKQKVDLLFELYARHGFPNSKVKSGLTKSAMLKAEEFRNQIVHSVWAFDGKSPKSWMRTKSNLRGNNGLNIVSKHADAQILQHAAESMNKVRDWESCEEIVLQEAIEAFSKK